MNDSSFAEWIALGNGNSCVVRLVPYDIYVLKMYGMCVCVYSTVHGLTWEYSLQLHRDKQDLIV